MANIDDRVVSMSFEAQKFQTGVSQTLSSLDKLNAALKTAGANNGLDNIEKSASKISFGGLSSAIDKLKAKFGMGFPEADQAFSNVEKGSGKVGFTPLSSAIDKIKSKFGYGFPEADQAFSDVEKGSGKVGFTPLTSAIDKLKGQFSHIPEGAGEAFSGVENASGKVTFHGLTQAIDSVAGRFSILQGAASVALGNISAQAAQRGASFVKSLALGPILDGYHEYETNINSIQTILSNTKASGATLGDVNSALNQLNTYADKTIYNFTEMTKNIGTFTAAGVDLNTAVGSIKGIANLAALSGSNSQQASTAMYQLSQAISAGRVGLQDWNSVVNAGMGGTVFQRALAQTAEKMGTLKDGAVKLAGPMKNVKIDGQSFRESIQAKPGEQSWLTGKVLTTTLKQLSGDMSDAQLKAQGYSDAQIKAIQSQAKMAVNAATQVKTLSALLDTTKEAIGSGWTKSWQIVFGDFGQAKTLFTGLSNAIGGFVSASSNARNKVLGDWAKLGGRKVLLDGLKDAFIALKSVVTPIKDAFRDIFPPKTGQDLYDLTVRFRDFMKNLAIGPSTAAALRSSFKGLFAILDIGKQIVGGIFTAIGHMFGALGSGSGGILHLTGNIGELITQLDQWLKRGDKIKTFFAGLGDVLSIPIRLLGTLSSKVSGLFSGNIGGGAKSAVSGIGASLSPAVKAADAAKNAWSGFMRVVQHVGDILGPVAKGIADAFGNIGEAIANSLKGANMDSVFTVVQTGLVAGIFLTIKKALGGGLKFDIGGGVLKNVSASLDVLRGSLVSIQKNIQAHTLLLIASAVGVLSASVVALSLIKPEKLASSMTAISVGMAQLMAAMAILGKASGSMGMIKAPLMAASLILLATAIDTLAAAVLILSRLSWDELARGLTGVVGLLAAVSIATIPLSKGGPGMIAAGAGLIAVGVALNILAGAMKIFATMSWEELGKGLAAVAGSLVVVGAAMQLMPLTMPLTGAGLILVGVGLTAVAGAVKIFASMKLSSLAKGIGAIAASLIVIGLAMQAMPLTLPLTGAGLILVGAGLSAVAGAVRLMGGFKIGTIVKGLTGLAAALGVLAVGLTLMVAALPGAAALLVASAALAVFVPVLGILGTMSWKTIAKGLAAIAASLLVIGVGGSLAAPGLIALGIGLAAFGVGVTAVGGGVYLLAKGISLLATNGGKGLAVFVAAMTAMVLSLPRFIVSFVQGLVQIIASIANLAPLVVASVAKIVDSLLNVVILSSPKFAQATTALITAMLVVLAQNAGPLIAAGWKLLIQLLNGISTHISQVTTTVADIVSKFLTALSGKASQLVAAGAKFLASLLAGIANNLAKVVSSAADLIVKYIGALASGATKIVTAGANMTIKLVSGLASKAAEVVAKGAEAIIKFISGVASKTSNIVAAGAEAAGKFINAVGTAMGRLGAEGAKAVLALLHSIRDNIAKYEPQFIQAGIEIGLAIMTGIPLGIARGLTSAVNSAVNAVGNIIKSAKHKAGIKSPSSVFAEIGGYMMDGLALGIGNNTQGAINASASMAAGVIQKFKDVFQIQSPSKVMLDLGQYVVGGFVDGLLGNSAPSNPITDAFTELGNKLSDAITNTNSTLQTKMNSLDSLLDAKNRDWSAIDKASALVLKSWTDLQSQKAAHDLVVHGLTDEKNQLKDLAKQYDEVVAQLENANTVLDNAKKARTDAVGQFSDQYATLPSIVTTDENGNPIDSTKQLANYQQQLVNQADAVYSYRDTLDQLRELGLDDATYQKLLQEGTADQQFADALLAGGVTAVQGLNSLDQGLRDQANVLADHASHSLFDAGVAAAQGIVDGLESKKSEIRKTMESIATAMIKAIKAKLKMKSPSKEFAKIGQFSSEGLAYGLSDSAKAVTDAAGQIGDDALVAMRKSMNHISSAMSEIDSNPTITPILDLSQVKKDAKQLDKMTNVVPITAAASYGLASMVALTQSEIDAREAGGVGTIQFVQNNTSPKTLSETEIYRNTNNQLSQAKSLLGL
jgi:tape measure domain-containing protein